MNVLVPSRWFLLVLFLVFVFCLSVVAQRAMARDRVNSGKPWCRHFSSVYEDYDDEHHQPSRRNDNDCCTDHPKIREIQQHLLSVFHGYDDITRKINNHITLQAHNKSFTIDKKHIHLCLYDPNGNYYPDDMLLYVAIHELAHVFCSEIGHTPKFYEIFNELLAVAQTQGRYSSDFHPISDYCQHNHDHIKICKKLQIQENDDLFK